LLAEGLSGVEVGEGRKGGEIVADPQEKVAVAKVPEVLRVVMQMPGGAGEDTGGGKFKENSVDDAVLIILRLIGQSRYQAVNNKGEEKMVLVDVVQCEHGAAIKQELGGKGLETEFIQRDAKWWLRSARQGRQSGKKEKAGQSAVT